MRTRLALSPWWVQGAVYGVLFGVAMTVLEIWQSGRWLSALSGGLLGAIVFGIGMGPFTSRLNGRLLGPLRELGPEQQKAVTRASGRGPWPADPQLRATAHGLLQRPLGTAERWRPVSVVFFSLALVLYGVAAVVTSAWWWVAVVALAALLALALVQPVRLRRRLVAYEAAWGTIDQGAAEGGTPRAV